MSYNLNETVKNKDKTSFLKASKSLNKYLKGLKWNILFALICVAINSATSIITPLLLGDVVDKYVLTKDLDGLKTIALNLLIIFGIGFASLYLQILVMGRVGQVILFRVRNSIFEKIQSLPIEFFNVNKSGDLISRINNDTEKLNQAFSEILLRFIGNIFIIIGMGVMMIRIDTKLGLIALSLSLGILIITQACAKWVKTKNRNSLDAFGNLSAEIQESLNNFKVIIAFNRRDYFRNNFENINESNRKASTLANIANSILTPIYDLAGNIATVLVIIFGLRMLATGGLTPGELLSFILYVDRFYQPLRIMASLFASIQSSLAAWSRVSEILKLKTNLNIEGKSSDKLNSSNHALEFKNVDFGYTPDTTVLKHLNFVMDKGKTYAFVGPTGGGKSTTASLIARLYDRTDGEILLNGKDIKSYSPEELSTQIGFILQEPFLFTSTVGENIKYGNHTIEDLTNAQLTQQLKSMGLAKILERFKDGLDTEVKNNADSISLGQKQLIAFLRILLRQPQILILDEATANIDTVTESLLQEIIDKLPESTTKIIIAHRLNTIQKADQIFFIANGEIQKPISFENAMDLINSVNRNS
jgi:ATP-binding cassette subfamily B protein